MGPMSAGLPIYLNMLFGAERQGSFIELRYKRDGGGMGQSWFGVRELDRAAQAIRRLGATTDTYVGVLPRAERRGCRDAIRQGHVLFIDCDTPESIKALEQFAPAPSMVISSGRGRHVYWALGEPLAAGWIEKANRRLAHALGADMRATDAARILRPLATFNFKGSEPRPVTIETLNIEVYTAAEVVGELSDPPKLRSSMRMDEFRAPRAPSDDPLLDIEPTTYVEVLTGRQVGRDGKTNCPLPDHEDRTPSCHVYDDPEQGWFCYGCERGGTIYDLAAAVSGLDTRGVQFKRLREWISERLLNTPVAA
jgi:hypothetical protein